MFTTEQRLQTDLQFMQRCTFLIGVYYWTKTPGHLNNGKGRALLSNQRATSTFSTGGVCTSRRTSLERTMHRPAFLSASPHICYIYVPRHRGKEATWQKRKRKDVISVQPWSISKLLSSLPGMFNLSCWSMFMDSPTRDLRSVMHIRFCNRCESDVEKFTG